MRKIYTKGIWLIDMMFLERDSYKLHFFSFVMFKGVRCLFRTPDIRIPMPIKPVKVNQPRVLDEAGEILRGKHNQQ